MQVPTALLALEHSEVGRRVVSGVVSVITSPRLDVVAGASIDAAAVIWSDGISWFVRLSDGGEQALEVGTPLELEGQRFEVVSVALNTSGDITRVDPTQLDTPLQLRVRYDSVHIHRDGTPPVVLDGMVARVVSDLATAGVPMGWQLLARDLWPSEEDFAILRRNWDAALARLRKKLREARVRTDLARRPQRQCRARALAVRPGR